MVLVFSALGLLAVIVVYDLLQRQHAILRNFPIIGHFRYWFEAVGPELRQYIVTNNNEERPFSRDQRRWVYASSKQENTSFGFGSDQDMERQSNYLVIKHETFPLQTPGPGDPAYDTQSPIACAKVLGAARGRAKAFRPASVVNVSGHCQVAGRHPKLMPNMLCSSSDEIAIPWGGFDRVFVNLTMPSGRIESNAPVIALGPPTRSPFRIVPSTLPQEVRLVVDNLGLKEPSRNRNTESRLRRCVELYLSIQTWSSRVIRQDSFGEWRQRFDGLLPRFKHFTDIKKLDLFLWQSR